MGENLQYVVGDGQGRPLGCLVFGAAAWKCQDRDQFIGWSAQQRIDNLRLIANNHRFLILLFRHDLPFKPGSTRRSLSIRAWPLRNRYSKTGR